MSWQQYSASEKPGSSARFVLKWHILPLMNNSDLTFYINHLLSTCTTPQIPPGIINDEFQEKSISVLIIDLSYIFLVTFLKMKPMRSIGQIMIEQ